MKGVASYRKKRYFPIKATAVGFAALRAIGLSPSAFATKASVSQELPTPAYEVLNDTSVTHDITKYKEKSLKIQGNGTSKSTVKLSFSFESWLGESNKTLSVSCTKDGKSA